MKKEFIKILLEEHLSCQSCPSPREVSDFFQQIMGLLYWDYATKKLSDIASIESEWASLERGLEQLLKRNKPSSDRSIKKICQGFFDQIPAVYSTLNQDIRAIYEGDPACTCHREVIRSYPGFYAIAAYRIAHAMYVLGIRDFPRIITEHAHSITGIDIHPGAQIAPSFCIDHGTGIVIGETSVIHKEVKIYQGVTLGALSVKKCDADNKRHPTIERGCVLYANATILGGDTIIGHDSIIGGNTWITRSVPPQSKIYYQALMNTDEGALDRIVYKNYAK